MILKRLKIETMVGNYTNCYVIADEEKKEAMIIDPAGEVEKIIETIKLLDVSVKYIYVTHCHADHTAGLEDIKKEINAKILIHRAEFDNLQNPDVNLSGLIGVKNIEVEADARVDEDDSLHVGDIEFRVIYTPGHTIGGSSLYCEKHKLLFSGDTLFKGTYGRCDLPTGNEKDILNSIKRKLLTLPEDTLIYPGHGEPGLIGEEQEIYIY